METKTRKEFPPFYLVKYQCLAAVCANIATFCHGITIGWSAPSVWLMLTDDSPFKSGKISLEESSWIGSALYLGYIVGNFLYAFISKRFNLRIAMSLLVLPNLIAWIIILCADYPFQVIIARFITGISSGGVSLCLPLYIAEISNKNIRGILGSIFMIIFSLGMLFALIITSYVPYRVTPYIFMAPGLIYICSILRLPETPQSLLLANKSQEAEQSFRFYNFANKQDVKMTSNVMDEYEELRSAVMMRQLNSDEGSTTLRTCVTDKDTIKGLSIGIFLIALALFSGIFSINAYSISIFNETGTEIDPTISAITVTLIQLIGSSITSVLVDRWGRRVLLSASCLGSAISIFGFATFAYLYKTDVVLTSFYWIPITTMAIYIFSNNAGILSLPFVIIAELLPQRTRRVGSSICFLPFGAFAFINVKLFPILSEYWGLHTIMWIYSGVCLLGFCFTILVLEETKGKTLNS